MGKVLKTIANNVKDFGTGLIKDSVSQTANGIIQQMFAEHNRSRNFYWNEKAADSADQRQRKQYMDLYSPEAMLQQYAAAGLSPSMMLSGGQSAVGQSSAQGNQSAGIQGPYPTAQPTLSPMHAAQIANMNADTKLKETEAEEKKEETTGKQIENYIQSTLIPTSIDSAKQELEVLKSETQKLVAEVKGINWKNAFNTLTQDEQVQALVNKNAELQAQVVELTAKAALHREDIKLKDQERQTMIQQCIKWQKDTAQKYIELDIYAESQAAQEAWFEEQAYLGNKNMNLEQDMFDFERGEKFEFEKFKVGQAINQAWWKLGLDFGASLLHSAANYMGARSIGAGSLQQKQMELDHRSKPYTQSESIDYFDNKGKKKGFKTRTTYYSRSK